jgi:hypothetical protein
VRLLSNLLRRFIREGTLRVRDADGEVHVFGDRLPGPNVAIHLHDRKLYTKLFINPSYMRPKRIWTARSLWKMVLQFTTF